MADDPDWDPSPEEEIRDLLEPLLPSNGGSCTHVDGGNCPLITIRLIEGDASSIPQIASIVTSYQGRVEWRARVDTAFSLGFPDIDPESGMIDANKPNWEQVRALYIGPQDYLDDYFSDRPENFGEECEQTTRFWRERHQYCLDAKGDLDGLLKHIRDWRKGT